MLTRSVSAEYNSQIKIEIEALSAHVHICPDMRSLVKIPNYNVNNRIISDKSSETQKGGWLDYITDTYSENDILLFWLLPHKGTL